MSVIGNQLITFLGWRDFLEILFFSMIFYFTSRWLRGNQRNNLLLYFYCYCFLILFSSWAVLPMLNSFLITFAPVAAMLFILFHQEILQKNFITLCRYLPAQKVSCDWQQELIRLALIARNKGVQVCIIIEHNEKLDTILTAPFLLESAFHHELVMTLLMSQSFDQEKFVWLRADGSIVSINATLAQLPDDTWKEKEIRQMPRWQQDALLISTKTDALIISTDITTVTFTLIAKGTIISALSAENVVKCMKHSRNVFSDKPQRAYFYEHKKSSKKQQFSS